MNKIISSTLAALLSVALIGCASTKPNIVSSGAKATPAAPATKKLANTSADQKKPAAKKQAVKKKPAVRPLPSVIVGAKYEKNMGAVSQAEYEKLKVFIKHINADLATKKTTISRVEIIGYSYPGEVDGIAKYRARTVAELSKQLGIPTSEFWVATQTVKAVPAEMGTLENSLKINNGAVMSIYYNK